jgi:hypothetical protein
VDTALNVKTVLREGALQGRPGPSVAGEVGVLLPTANDEPGIGAQAAAIVSQRFGSVTAHFKAAAALTRAKRLDLIGSITSKALGGGRSDRFSQRFRCWRAGSKRRSAPSQG